MLGRRVKNIGVAKEGIERQSNSLGYWGPEPATTASGWASKAFRASQAAKAAQAEAEGALREAEHHQQIAASSADQAKAAALQMDLAARSSVGSARELGPYLKFCRQIAEYLGDHPQRADEPALLRLRRFCGGLDAHLDRANRAGSPSAALELGFRMYARPPQQYPAQPVWGPAVPELRAPLDGPAPRLEVRRRPHHFAAEPEATAPGPGPLPARPPPVGAAAPLPEAAARTAGSAAGGQAAARTAGAAASGAAASGAAAPSASAGGAAAAHASFLGGAEMRLHLGTPSVEMPVSLRALAAALLLAVSASGASLRMLKEKKVSIAKAHVAGRVVGESRAAEHFFKEWVRGLPRNMTKEKQDAVVATLEAEVSKLGDNVAHIKAIQKNETSQFHNKDSLKKALPEKDQKMMDSMDEWSTRMNQKAKMGAMNVMSKLKNAIHLIKKGALSGNDEAAGKLEDVLKQMTTLSR
ncbi:unnamed protein product [Prorocentrum cordatum]|nr:unnamed protein product [Polarella glacialis]